MDISSSSNFLWVLLLLVLWETVAGWSTSNTLYLAGCETCSALKENNNINQRSRWVFVLCVSSASLLRVAASGVGRQSTGRRNVWLCIPAWVCIRQEAGATSGVNSDVRVCLCVNMATVVGYKVCCLARAMKHQIRLSEGTHCTGDPKVQQYRCLSVAWPASAAPALVTAVAMLTQGFPQEIG